MKRELAALGRAIRELGGEGGREAYGAELRALSRLLGPALRSPWRTARTRTLLDAVQQHARTRPHAIAVRDPERSLAYAELARRIASVASALRDAGVAHGDTVALLAPNDAHYLVAILAIAWSGARAALVNPALQGAPLAHAIRAASPRFVLAHASHSERLDTLSDDERPRVLPFGATLAAPDAQLAPATPPDEFVDIYTSGTTGLPKPVPITHARAATVGYAFAHAVWEFGRGTGSRGCIYAPLPLYHASALLLGAGAALIAGATIAIRPRFSARAYWDDVREFEADRLLYIGELCRYLVHSAPHPAERQHEVKIAVGNGLRPEVWRGFQDRFGIETVREFYGATEAPGFLINLAGREGRVGHAPLYGAWMQLVRFDHDRQEPARDAVGRCEPCDPGEVGELVVKLYERAPTPLHEFRGYRDTEATRRKVLHDVFAPGDRYYRTGDLLAREPDGYFRFVDRVGDTFRYQGENVATTEVELALALAEGVREVAVVGVQLAGIDGRVGMAVVVADGAPAQTLAELDAAAESLPPYARPRFVRFVGSLETTSTHKLQKAPLRAAGIDPERGEGEVFHRPGLRLEAAWERLDRDRHAALSSGER